VGDARREWLKTDFNNGWGPFVVAGNGLLIAEGSDNYGTPVFRAFDRTGTEVWESMPSEPTTTTDTSNLVYVTYVNGTDTTALDATTGDVAWTADCGGHYRVEPYYGTILVDAGRVVVGDSMMDKLTGDCRDLLPHPARAEQGGVWYSSNGRMLSAMNDAGSFYWRARVSFEPLHYNPAPVTVGDGLVYVAGSRVVRAFSTSTGARVWSYNFGETGFSYNMALANGALYVGRPGGYIYALNADDGKKLWRARLSRRSEYGRPPHIAVANGVLYATSEGLYAFNAVTGTKLLHERDYSSDGPPVVANGMIFHTSEDFDDGSVFLYADGLPFVMTSKTE